MLVVVCEIAKQTSVQFLPTALGVGSLIRIGRYPCMTDPRFKASGVSFGPQNYHKSWKKTSFHRLLPQQRFEAKETDLTIEHDTYIRGPKQHDRH
jgi:hypothetical protein